MTRLITESCSILPEVSNLSSPGRMYCILQGVPSILSHLLCFVGAMLEPPPIPEPECAVAESATTCGESGGAATAS